MKLLAYRFEAVVDITIGTINKILWEHFYMLVQPSQTARFLLADPNLPIPFSSLCMNSTGFW